MRLYCIYVVITYHFSIKRMGCQFAGIYLWVLISYLHLSVLHKMLLLVTLMINPKIHIVGISLFHEKCENYLWVLSSPLSICCGFSLVLHKT